MGKRKRHYRSTIERARLIAELTQQHYEPGNNAKCYKQVWRNVVRKVYPMSYRTFLNPSHINWSNLEVRNPKKTHANSNYSDT